MPCSKLKGIDFLFLFFLRLPPTSQNLVVFPSFHIGTIKPGCHCQFTSLCYFLHFTVNKSCCMRVLFYHGFKGVFFCELSVLHSCVLPIIVYLHHSLEVPFYAEKVSTFKRSKQNKTKPSKQSCELQGSPVYAVQPQKKRGHYMSKFGLWITSCCPHLCLIMRWSTPPVCIYFVCNSGAKTNPTQCWNEYWI